jgi:uncharacterized Zn-binding protein involved in type VI secretion
MPAGITRNAGADFAGGGIITGSPNVFANGKPVARVDDNVESHGLSPHSEPIMATGSPNVFTNDKATCRQGDNASCGCVSTGSSNVFVN